MGVEGIIINVEIDCSPGLPCFDMVGLPDAPDMWQTQRECIQNGDVDFVITRKYKLDRYSPSSKGYALVDEATFYFEGVDFTYYLYQKLPDA